MGFVGVDDKVAIGMLGMLEVRKLLWVRVRVRVEVRDASAGYRGCGGRWPEVVFGTLIAWSFSRGLRWCSEIGRVVEAA